MGDGFQIEFFYEDDRDMDQWERNCEYQSHEGTVLRVYGHHDDIYN